MSKEDKKTNKKEGVPNEAQNSKIKPIFVPPLKRKIAIIPIKATPGVPLIFNAPDPNMIHREITAPQVGKAKIKSLRNMDEEYNAKFHRLPSNKNKYGFPVGGFKGAMLQVAKDPHMSGVTGEDIRRHTEILPTPGEGSLVEIKCKNIKRIQDITMVKRGTLPNETHRPYFYDWTSTLIIEYDEDVFSIETILHLVQRAGKCGIGTWRPSSKNPGPNGTWVLDNSRKVVG